MGCRIHFGGYDKDAVYSTCNVQFCYHFTSLCSYKMRGKGGKRHFKYLQSLYYIKSWGTIFKNDETNCLVGSRQVATNNKLGSQHPNTNEIFNKDFINWEIIHIYRTGIYLKSILSNNSITFISSFSLHLLKRTQ